MPPLPIPVGTVAFLFTDIVGSTRLWERYQQTMSAALTRHDEIIKVACSPAGYVFKTVGDSFCVAFESAQEAVSSAMAAQIALTEEVWPENLGLTVRMAIHAGAVESRDGDYFGPAVNRVARLMATAHGGQIVVSQSTAELLGEHLPHGVTLRNIGLHRLRDLGRAETVFQVESPGLRADFPPLLSLDNSQLRHNLPQQTTTFVGRDREMIEVSGLFEKTRLLTITGGGGSGKTRLALQLAADLLKVNSDGAWLIELGAIEDPRVVAHHIASTLGLKEEPGKIIMQTVVEFLRTKELILVLDTCEHLLSVSASFVDAVLRQCPKIQFVVTSREVLGVQGETIYRLPPLSLPDLHVPASIDMLAESEAAQLFLDRAAHAKPAFSVSDDTAPILASLCHRLDGNPLAIELAAARVRSLSLEEINGNLDQRFRFLTGGSRTALPRQQTLRSLIDWSYDLLSVKEKRLLGRLSVFAGGWNLEAAETVCSNEQIREGDVLDIMTSLVDKSLVTVEEGGSTTRYRLLESVRQYAKERLQETGEFDAWKQRHAEFVLDLASQAESLLRSPRSQAPWELLETEHDNIRSALRWALTVKESGTVAKIAGRVWRFWSSRGYFTEGRDWLSRASEHPGVEASDRARCLAGGAALAWMQSDHEQASELAHEALAQFEALGVQEGAAMSLNILALLCHASGDYESAIAFHERSLAIKRDIGDLSGIATSLNNLGNIAFARNDFERARDLVTESRDLFHQMGDRRGYALASNNLGDINLELGNVEAAYALVSESLAICREQGEKRGVAAALNTMGSYFRAKHRLEEAQSHHRKAREIYESVGDRWSVGTTLYRLALLTFAQGDTLQAKQLLVESIALAKEVGDRRGIMKCLKLLAENTADTSNLGRAVTIWRGAARIGGTLDAEKDLPPPMQDIRTRIGDTAFAEAWAEGEMLSEEGIISLALDSVNEQSAAKNA